MTNAFDTATTSHSGRQIVIDTETTGVDFLRDRVAEIGAVELIDLRPTGRTFHTYVNPGMPMPADATAVHGLTDGMLAGCPKFAAVAAALVDFIGDAPLIAHNANFDVGILNAELERHGMPALASQVVDTLAMARAKHPGSPASLDALCRRYGIATAARTKHGALIDAQLLAEVYVELVGRQRGLDLAVVAATVDVGELPTRLPLPGRLTEAELVAHAAMIADMPKTLWSHQ
ncbi:DNA polymerase III subunit epsilon [Mesorhizobium sp. BR-1-1-8]|uniref:DNA polymerase III subunit epsilon n=1 Tax=unclassified Mesorhizobium TaxID=325217 RepID=UPI001CCD0A5D|nr:MULTISPECIES: DNA polymerase III subunit epsilon [unclassified Mesorhizobium]MBZ9973491.1 DNA polymerase III subunit epsilon [Mesorhizobium sp. BR1-1-12]MBZ9984950.1 DNA polymerase III subunit epsilon [Mesorhizobium sp. BR-1-1-8]